jgi:methylthioribose-1-phosphate isomerase
MKNLKSLPKTIELKKDYLLLIDQTKLPGSLKYLKLTNYPQVIKAIKDMRVRGAQAIGLTGAGGVFLASRSFKGGNVLDLEKYLHKVGGEIIKARPTAINLAWAVGKMLASPAARTVKSAKAELVRRYSELLDSEMNNNILIGKFGEKLIKSGMNILTHCNAGSLSGVWFGTATAPIYAAHARGKKIKVLVDETRPWLQGARLTAWELEKAGIDYSVNVDSAAGYLMAQGMVDMVIVGADHIALNGDTANKIGTYQLAVLAKKHRIPFYVAAVSGTVDKSMKTGKGIKIEERAGAEVLLDIKYRDKKVAPSGAKAFNPVFDITPTQYITGFITEQGILKPKELYKIK